MKIDKHLKQHEMDRCVVEKEFICQTCNAKYKNYVVRKLKIKTLYTESDLRPICEPVDPNFYDVLLCSNCGYVVLTLFAEKKIKKDNIDIVKQTMQFYYVKREYPKFLTPKYVIERYKLALISAILKGANTSEKAYICLKLAWVYRSMEDKENEKLYLTNAAYRFEKAFLEEEFPICGLDQSGLSYLIGAIYQLIGNYQVSMEWIAKVLTSKDISTRLKNKALELKEEIRAKTNK